MYQQDLTLYTWRDRMELVFASSRRPIHQKLNDVPCHREFIAFARLLCVGQLSQAGSCDKQSVQGAVTELLAAERGDLLLFTA